jgi:putative membrane protein
VMVGTHFSGLYDAAVRDQSLHALEHLLYLGAGVLFWAPLVGADPTPQPLSPASRVLYLLLAMPPMALVGVALVSSAEVRYPAYLEPARELGVSALADQHAAGMIMWAGGTAVLGAAVLVLGWDALRREERRVVARETYAGANAERESAQ